MTKPHSGNLSIIPAAAVFDSRLCRTDLAVLCALGVYADRNGRCWPATTTLAKDIRVTTRQVRRCLRNLEDCGYLHTEYPPGQRSVYVINRKGADPGHPGSGVPRTYSDTTPDTQVPPNGVTNGVNERKHTGVPVSDQQFQNFWRTYPSRRPHSNPKKPARAKFDAALKRGVAMGDIIRGAQNYAAYVEREGTNPSGPTRCSASTIHRGVRSGGLCPRCCACHHVSM